MTKRSRNSIIFITTLLALVVIGIGSAMLYMRAQQSQRQNATLSTNASIEYEAVRAKAPEQCDKINGQSIALGPVDETISISEKDAKERCRSAATSGDFGSPHIEALLKNQIQTL